ncbi:MAG: hypothetical protein HRU14_07070 [Planctomycetes bacterium]|nr:hypothetical protein [Planctomycetota bacterium]
MLIAPASLALPIPFGHEATGAFSIGFYIDPTVVNLVGGSTVCGQVNGFDPASARLYASNAVAVTFGH